MHKLLYIGVRVTADNIRNEKRRQRQAFGYNWLCLSFTKLSYVVSCNLLKQQVGEVKTNLSMNPWCTRQAKHHSYFINCHTHQTHHIYNTQLLVIFKEESIYQPSPSVTKTTHHCFHSPPPNLKRLYRIQHLSSLFTCSFIW